MLHLNDEVNGMNRSRNVSETDVPGDVRLRVAVDETDAIEVSVVMPCLNEAETLGVCISKAKAALSDLGISGEVVVADNGSTDGSQDIAAALGARVVHVSAKGYGSALIGGIAGALGKYVIMGDADDSYDFLALQPFIERLRAGDELVMGNRFSGEIRPGAMPPLHKYLGNPVLTGIGRLLFSSPCGDFHCGLRGFRRDAILAMNLRTTGMEFASELVVKATLFGLRISEVPVTLSKDGRSRPPHLRSWRDGWRHLRFLLLYCPRWLFLIPGAMLMAGGLFAGAWLLGGPRTISGVTFDVHSLLYCAAVFIIGVQSILFALFAKIFAVTEGLLPPDPTLDRLFRFVNLERGLMVGAALTVAGLLTSAYAIGDWGAVYFGPLDPSRTLRVVIPGVTFLIVGFQLTLSSFFFSILGLARK